MMLLVDLGNTSIKWARSDGQWWHADQRMHADQSLEEVLDGTWHQLDAPERIVACSVATTRTWQALVAWCESRWHRTPQRIVSVAQFGDVRNGYREPAQLGVDRWAALVAARDLVKGDAVVVDCGTALTVDWIDESGMHRGGVIFPGLALLRTSLRTGTGGIQAIEGDDSSCLAQTTADGVTAGTAFGLVGAIERVLKEMEQRMASGQVTVLITGGDAGFVAARMQRPARHVPDLVLLGLKRIADTL